MTAVHIKVTRGLLRTGGRVSVKYNPQALAADGTNTDLLVMLISDHHGGWVALPTSADSGTLTASAEWPHFSDGLLGYFKSPVDWLVDHIATYPLGPVKKPDCTQKKSWNGPDKGWTAANPNWNGGPIFLNPLHACIEKASTAGGIQRVDVTNRYWYGMMLSLPPGVQVTTSDAFDASALSDAMISELYSKAFGYTLVPGHSYAHMRVTDDPAGQQISMNAYADPLSFIINAVLSVLDIASLGESSAELAELEAAEDELFAGIATGENTLTEVEGKLAPGSAWRRQQEEEAAKKSNKTLNRLDSFFSIYATAACIADGFRDSAGSKDGGKPGTWEDLTGLLDAAVKSCKADIILTLLGQAYRASTPKAQAELSKKILDGLTNTKKFSSTGEGILAITAKAAGKDYLRSRLVLTQAHVPGYVADGTYHGHVTAFNSASRLVTFHKVEFSTSNPAQLCQENGVTAPPDAELCNEYYYKDDHMLLSIPVSPTAEISDWHPFNNYNSGPGSYGYTLAQFAETVQNSPGKLDLFSFTVRNGQVVAISGIFTP